MPVTKRGIYHNLKESKYTISNGEIVCFFSSNLYLDKFLSSYEEHREKMKNKLSIMYGDNDVCINTDMLADVILYKKIEKRGFRMCIKGFEISWEDVHQYAISKMSRNESLEWRKIKTPTLKQRLNIK